MNTDTRAKREHFAPLVPSVMGKLRGGEGGREQSLSSWKGKSKVGKAATALLNYIKD